MLKKKLSIAIFSVLVGSAGSVSAAGLSSLGGVFAGITAPTADQLAAQAAVGAFPAYKGDCSVVQGVKTSDPKTVKNEYSFGLLVPFSSTNAPDVNDDLNLLGTLDANNPTLGDSVIATADAKALLVVAAENAVDQAKLDLAAAETAVTDATAAADAADADAGEAEASAVTAGAAADAAAAGSANTADPVAAAALDAAEVALLKAQVDLNTAATALTAAGDSSGATTAGNKATAAGNDATTAGDASVASTVANGSTNEAALDAAAVDLRDAKAALLVAKTALDAAAVGSLASAVTTETNDLGTAEDNKTAAVKVADAAEQLVGMQRKCL